SANVEPPFRVSIEVSHTVDGPCWFAARCVDGETFAHTSPVFVTVDGQMPADADALRQYHDWLGRTVDWVETEGRFEAPRRKMQLQTLLEQARQELMNRLPRS